MGVLFINKKKKHPWFRPKHYLHIGLPLKPSDIKTVAGKVKNAEFVSKYAFLPLIHRRHVSTKRKRYSDGIVKTRKKVRHICFASHFDAQIYSYYSWLLSKRYEKWVRENGLSENIIAYRTIKSNCGKGNKGHIHFADEVFNEIRTQSKHNEAVGVVVSDISGFFDNLDHRYLLDEWKSLLAVDKLPSDHRNIFRNVTRFSYIDENKLFRRFRKRIVCRKNGKIVRRPVLKQKQLRHYDAIAFCLSEDLKEIRDSRLIETGDFNRIGFHLTRDESGNPVRKGIPQGLPISAMLANIYMRDFDKCISEYVKSCGGMYRRYSDDISIVIPYKHVEAVKKQLFSQIRGVKLQIEKSKTETFKFLTKDGKLQCITDDGVSTKLVYLGFSFDGERILLKDKSVSSYYHKMEKYFGRAYRYSISIKNATHGNLFVNRIIKRFTTKGAKTQIIQHGINKKGENYCKRIQKYGNYHTYVKRAIRITSSDAIWHQLSKNLTIVKTLISETKQKIAEHGHSK